MVSARGSAASADVVIGLSAVVFGARAGETLVLTVRPQAMANGIASPAGLPFGPFHPETDLTFELALRAFVTEQTGFKLGWVEQLYTFGNKGRDAPLADVGAGTARVISVGYLGLTPKATDTPYPGAAWSPWLRFFPWEDWREGRPALIDTALVPRLMDWAGRAEARKARVRRLFALEGALWKEERVLERYELLYEAGLAPEAARDRAIAAGRSTQSVGVDEPEPALGEPMISDHRRILATGLGRLRGKLRYRPVVFELAPEIFTLSALQKLVEGIGGIALHKQNFRRALERTGLVESAGRYERETGGRPAELYRFAREKADAGEPLGLNLPALR